MQRTVQVVIHWLDLIAIQCISPFRLSWYHAQEVTNSCNESLGATSIVKIGEVRLSDEIGGG